MIESENKPMYADFFVEIGHWQVAKYGETSEGDVFISRKTEDGRIIAVLSDGLGSGIKAGVLAALTATIATGCSAARIPIKRTARIIMRSLPVCSERKISYATFTLVDIDTSNRIKVVEYDNPAYMLVRQGVEVEPLRSMVSVTKGGGRIAGHPKPATLRSSRFKAEFGDRVIFFSDGVTQAGMGSRNLPLGWGLEGVRRFVSQMIAENAEISARDLARRIVTWALLLDGDQAKDDITCAVVYLRAARRLAVFTGPPLHPAHDNELARLFASSPGRTIIAGGTTATIIGRELGRKITMDLKHRDPELPPVASMEGADLVTEGILTLSKTADYLEQDAAPEELRQNAATAALRLMLDSDIIEFFVGTKINEAHQDPNMPVELDIRRNVVKRLAHLLEGKYLKQTTIRYI